MAPGAPHAPFQNPRWATWRYMSLCDSAVTCVIVDVDVTRMGCEGVGPPAGASQRACRRLSPDPLFIEPMREPGP